jgi:serine acetyltransferase/glycosyltransferase involved in cell wall biosynthesis
MDFILTSIFILTIALSAYTYFIYPAIVWTIGALHPFKPLKKEVTPSVSIIIAAYNEAKHIQRKIENTLGLDYPADKLEIVVGSDGSRDNTADIVTRFSDRGVRLFDFDINRGKTAVQNDLVRSTKNDVLVFTDAASFMPPNSLKALVRSFANPTIGCVAGKMVFVNTDKNLTTQSQGLYWKYEVKLREMESRIGSLIGVDGPLYAVRRDNYIPLADNIISDFVTPLLVLTQNKKVIFENDAVIYEEPTEHSQHEFKTRRRITLRGLVGLKKHCEVLSFKKHPLVAFQVCSHKLLRWFVGPMIVLNLLATMMLFNIPFFKLALFLHALFYCLALVGMIRKKNGKSGGYFKLPYYFCLVNSAATMGIYDFMKGKQIATWKPVRESAESERTDSQNEIRRVMQDDEQAELGLLRNIVADLNRYTPKDSGFLKRLKTIMLTQGIWAVLMYRLGSWVYKRKKNKNMVSILLMPFCTVLSKSTEILTGIQIPFSAKIGPGFYIGHFGCIFVGKDAIIGENCNISQGVTIGQGGRGGNQKTPVIGNRVYIGPGAKLFGEIRIGNDVAIGANSVVTKDLPDNAVAVGVPAEIINYQSSKDFVVL